VHAQEASRWIKQQAFDLGFERCGIVRSGPIGRGDYLRAWLASGRAGSMAFLQRNLESRLDPTRLLPDARSAIVVALNYYQPEMAEQNRDREGVELEESHGATEAGTHEGEGKDSLCALPDAHGQKGAVTPRGKEQQTDGPKQLNGDATSTGNIEIRSISNLKSQIDNGLGRAATITTGLTPPGATGGLTASVESEEGRIARYAWGRDYHRVVKGKLHKLADAMRARFGPNVSTRACVDTAPVIERELAAQAGVGWIGKNTMVLHQELGSYFVLGVLLTTLELEPDEPLEDHCGSCNACLDACPTDAFPKPYEMDASRCLSYLTIEHRGDIPAEFHSKVGDWVFGCDVCQEVCPFNRRPPVTNEPDFTIRRPGPAIDPKSILNWTPEDYDKITRGSATRRATLEMWKRNAGIVGIQGAERAG